MDFKALGMGLAFALMWSSAFTSARIIVHAAPPVTSLALRFLISGLIGVGIALAARQSWPRGRAQIRSIIVFGICQNALYLGLYFVAMQRLEAGFASIIASTMPLLVAMAGWLFFRERLPVLGVAGLLAGFAGVALILGSRIQGGADAYGILLCLIGVGALAFATLALRGASSGGNLMMVVGLQMLVGAAALAPFTLSESWQFQPSLKLGLAFLYTTLVPGLTATWVWFRLVNRIGAVRAATFHFLNPVFGVSIAAVLLGEHLGPQDLLGVAIVTAGILAVQVARISRA
jgi:probable blue pigment (indigoidine) exporter